ncbi:holo-[acyl-carrier-protein] synthase [Geotalea uraniireducens]|nr:holo-[acyl-carrier-protein] synthase [Geotalea uraniireducens]
MIFGTGVDIVEISRFERFLEEGNERLFERLFTVAEREYCAAKRRSAQHYALRFAAKEAFLKACGLGLRDGLSWHDVEVTNDALGKPELRLQGRAESLFVENGLENSFVSLSHDGNYAIAMVVLERR